MYEIDGRKFVNLAAAARLALTSPKTVKKWAGDEMIATVTVAGRRLYLLEDVEKIAAGKPAPASRATGQATSRARRDKPRVHA